MVIVTENGQSVGDCAELGVMAFSFSQFLGFLVLIFAAPCLAQMFEEISNVACFVRSKPYPAIECATLCANRYGVVQIDDREIYIATGLVTDDGKLSKCSCRLTIGLYNYLESIKSLEGFESLETEIKEDFSPEQVADIWYVKPRWAYTWVHRFDERPEFISMRESSRNVQEELEEFGSGMYKLPNEKRTSADGRQVLVGPYSVVTGLPEKQLDDQWARKPKPSQAQPPSKPKL